MVRSRYLSEQDPSANLSALVGDEAARSLLQENKVSVLIDVKIVHAEQVIENA